MVYRRSTILAVIAAISFVTGACSVVNDPAPDPTATAQPAPLQPTATATALDPTGTSTSTATASPTATFTMTPSPTATATATATSTPSPTPSPTPEPPKETPFGNVQALDPIDLTNFSLTIIYRAVGLPGNPNADIDLAIQQNSPENYHLRVVTDGVPVESWAANGGVFLLQEGGIVQLPPGIDVQLFAPAVFMHSTPLPGANDQARTVGVETIEGRQATHYRMDAADAARLAATDEAFVDGMRDTGGGLDIWVDVEWGIVLRITGAAAWTNADGSPGSVRYDYQLTAIGMTQPVAPPAQ